MTITGQAFQSGTCANFSTHFWCCAGVTKMFWSGGSKTPLYFCLPWTKTWMDAQVSQLTQHRVQNKLNSQYLALPYTIDCTHTHTPPRPLLCPLLPHWLLSGVKSLHT